MKYSKYNKDNHVISATGKAFNLLYKSRGYKANNEPTGEPKTEGKQGSNVVAYDEVTKAEIGQLLAEKHIEHNSRQNKQELYDLLLGSD